MEPNIYYRNRYFEMYMVLNAKKWVRCRIFTIITTIIKHYVIPGVYGIYLSWPQWVSNSCPTSQFFMPWLILGEDEEVEEPLCHGEDEVDVNVHLGLSWRICSSIHVDRHDRRKLIFQADNELWWCVFPESVKPLLLPKTTASPLHLVQAYVNLLQLDWFFGFVNVHEGGSPENNLEI